MPMTKAPDQIARRETSIERGLDFIYRVANTTDGFDSYGSLLICCFALVGATSRDADLREMARSRAQKLATTGRPGTEARGAGEELKGKAKNAVGRARSAAKKATR